MSDTKKCLSSDLSSLALSNLAHKKGKLFLCVAQHLSNSEAYLVQLAFFMSNLNYVIYLVLNFLHILKYRDFAKS